MGLVVQAPLDALLPLPTEGAAASAAPATDGLFASLLASLSTAVEGEAQDLGLDQAMLPDGTDRPDDQAESDPFAALFALTVPLAAPPPQDIVTITVAEGSPGMASVDAGVTVEPAALAANGVGVVPTGASPLEAVPVTDADAPIAPQPQPAREAPEEPPVAAEPPATDAAVEAPAADIAASPEPPPPPPGERPATERPAAETEALPATESPETSVVRTVGNAKTETELAGNGFGRRDADRPAPRASAQGIAHAAPNSAVGELRQAQPSAPAQGPAPAEAPASPLAALPQQVEQVATTVIETVDAGGGEARIHLDPVDLGEVTIHVHTDGDAVRIDVRAERQEAAQLLRDHTQDLSSLLGERGLNLSDVNVGLGRGNEGQGWGSEPQRRDGVVPGEFAALLGLDDAAAVEAHNRLRAAYNPDGKHLYRV